MQRENPNWNHRRRWIATIGFVAACGAALPWTAEATTLSYGIQALIDGRDHLIIRENTLQWHHFDFAAVGRHNGANAPTIVLGEMDGTTTSQFWIPDWSLPVPDEIRFEDSSSVFTNLIPLFPSDGMPWRVTTRVGRGSVEIVQQPTASNAHTLIVEFDDNPFGSSMFYSIEITPVPEPSAALLLSVGLCCAAARRPRPDPETAAA